MNALEWNRDYTRPSHEIRALERGQSDRDGRGNGTVCLPEMRKGCVGLCVATLIGRYVKPGNPLRGGHSPEQAWAQTQGQLAWYRLMEEQGELSQIKTVAQLNTAVECWSQNPPAEAPISHLLSLEGADSMVTSGRTSGLASHRSGDVCAGDPCNGRDRA